MALNQELREQDRLKDYLTPKLKDYIFDELSASYLQKAGVQEIMAGVPVPFHREDLASRSASTLMLASNMAFVIGCDPSFQYRDNYLAYIEKTFGKDFAKPLVSQGADYAKKEDYLSACILFRAAILVDPSFPDAVFCYGRACHDAYSSAEDREEEFVGRFKAEALDWFELLTETHPRFAMGFYYLGYQYLNIGLYKKAVLAWEEFLKFTHNKKDRKEIRHRIEQLEDPVRIEGGCLDITSGRYEEGLAVLEPYLQSQYKNWWPLHYYLGLGYQASGRTPDAVAEFKKVLMINGSHLETMRELLAIYEAQDDKQNIRKFSEKIRLIEEAQAEEQAKQLEETEKENKKIETEEAQPLPAEKIESFDMAEADEMTGSDTSGDAKAGLAEAEAAETDAAEAEADGGAAGPKEKERKPLVKRLRK